MKLKRECGAKDLVIEELKWKMQRIVDASSKGFDFANANVVLKTCRDICIDALKKPDKKGEE